MNATNENSVIVLGAGIVGVSCALALRMRGFDVTLVDRKAPGEETSFGNAGVIARSSCVALNNLALLRALPTLLKNQSNGFRFDRVFVGRNIAWAAQFLWNARAAKFAQTCDALGALIDASMPLHKAWLAQTQQLHRLRETGWLQLYRTQAAFDAAAWWRELLVSRTIAFESLDTNSLHEREPHLHANVFSRATHVTDAWSVDDPSAVTKAYAARFIECGGRIVQSDAKTATQTDDGTWQLEGTSRALRAGHLVVALGPWSKSFLATMQLRAPLAFERGYHTHFEARAPLRAPLYDVEAGYVATPTPRGIRVTTGVELNALDAPASNAQRDAILPLAREALPIGDEIEHAQWRGARPTLPDARPAIGASTKRANLWLAFGHQHIGFSTGPATGAAIAAMLAHESPKFDVTPFSPARYQL